MSLIVAGPLGAHLVLYPCGFESSLNNLLKLLNEDEILRDYENRLQENQDANKLKQNEERNKREEELILNGELRRSKRQQQLKNDHQPTIGEPKKKSSGTKLRMHYNEIDENQPKFKQIMTQTKMQTVNQTRVENPKFKATIVTLEPFEAILFRCFFFKYFVKKF